LPRATSRPVRPIFSIFVANRRWCFNWSQGNLPRFLLSAHILAASWNGLQKRMNSNAHVMVDGLVLMAKSWQGHRPSLWILSRPRSKVTRCWSG